MVELKVKRRRSRGLTSSIWRMTFKDVLLIPHLSLLTRPSHPSPILITTMGKAITKIVYKPDTQSSDEYLIIVNPEEVRQTPEITRFNPTHSLLA